MTIAILAWGSLVWNPGSLQIVDGWRPGGPPLPIEFSRISDNGRLTLVIDEACGVPVPTRFALSRFDNAEEAVADLQRRESAPTPHGVGIVDFKGALTSERARKNHPRAVEAIRLWAQPLGLDTVLWTAIGPRFAERTGSAFSVEAAMRYLGALPDPTRRMALEYIHNAPADVVTPVRTRVQTVYPPHASPTATDR